MKIQLSKPKNVLTRIRMTFCMVATHWFYTLVVYLVCTEFPPTFANAQEWQTGLYKGWNINLRQEINTQQVIHSIGQTFYIVVSITRTICNFATHCVCTFTEFLAHAVGPAMSVRTWSVRLHKDISTQCVIPSVEQPFWFCSNHTESLPTTVINKKKKNNFGISFLLVSYVFIVFIAHWGSSCLYLWIIGCKGYKGCIAHLIGDVIPCSHATF